MKTSPSLIHISLLALAPLLSQCGSVAKKNSDAPPTVAASPSSTKTAAPDKKQPAAVTPPAATSGDDLDDLNEYDVVEVSDPLEKLNRGTFWVNDKLYLVIFRPISKGYEFVIPKPARKGLDNVFDNARFPVRFINNALQGNFKRAGKETEKFLLDTVVGVGGIFKVSDKFESLASVPPQDTGITFAKWGMGHGPYIVIPVLGASSLRDGFGLAGDYAMNPINWGSFVGGNHDWTMIPPGVNTIRLLPSQLELYDDAKDDAIDPYIAIRSAYIQNRAEAVRK